MNRERRDETDGGMQRGGTAPAATSSSARSTEPAVDHSDYAARCDARIVQFLREPLPMTPSEREAKEGRAGSEAGGASGAGMGAADEHAGGQAPRDDMQLPAGLRGDLEAAVGDNLGDVRVHAGAKGTQTAAGHAARAVAIGQDVYVGQGQWSPETASGRELIGHEVAHTQQAKLSGQCAPAAKALDAPSSEAPAEQEADTFARAFSHDAAMTRWRPRVGISGAHAKRDDERLGDARAYFDEHHVAIFRVIQDHVAGLDLDFGHPRLRWNARGPAVGVRVVRQLETLILEPAGDMGRAKHTPKFFHPIDPLAVVDSNRYLSTSDAKGPLSWNRAVGEALAIEFGALIQGSLLRMAPRFVARADGIGVAEVQPGSLVTSTPLDRVSAALLCDRALVSYAAPSPTLAPQAGAAPKHDAGATPDGRDAYRLGARAVTFEWLGREDRRMWNWLRVTDPVDATAEEVAAQLYQYPGVTTLGSYNAFALTDAAPLFGLPRSWAKDFPDAVAWATREHSGDSEPVEAALTTSRLADDVALAQAADEPTTKLARSAKGKRADAARLAALLWKGNDQLGFMAEALAPYGLDRAVLAEQAWVQARAQYVVNAAPDELGAWAHVIEAQQRILFEASSGAQDVLASARGAGIVDPRRPGAEPFMKALRAYASALGSSHLVDLARTRLERADAERAQITLTLLDGAIGDAISATEGLREAEGGDFGNGPGAGLVGDRKQLQARKLEMRKQTLAGKGLDAGEVEDLAVDAGFVAFEARARTLQAKSKQLSSMVNAAGDDFAMDLGTRIWGDSSLAKVGLRLDDLASDCNGLLAGMLRPPFEDPSWEPPMHGDDEATEAEKLRDLRRRHLAQLQAKLAQAIQRNGLDQLTKDSVEAVGDAAIRGLAVDVAMLILASLATAGVASVVSGAVRGAVVGDAIVGTARFASAARRARVLATAVDVTVDASLNAFAQTGIMGGSYDSAFAENLLGNVAIRAALAPLQRLTASWGKLDESTAHLWSSKGKVIIAKGAALTAEMITGAAVNYVAQRIVRGGEPPTDSNLAAWAIMGGSMVVGRFVASRTTEMTQRLEQLGETYAVLAVRARAQRQLAKAVEESGDAAKALDLLGEHHRLLADEADILASLRTRPEKLAELNLTYNDYAALSRGNKAARADIRSQAMEVLPLRLAGLEEVVPGALWHGTHDEVETIVAQARNTGLDLQVVTEGGNGKRWRIKAGDQVLEIEVRDRGAGVAAQAHAAPPPAAIAKPADGDAEAEVARARFAAWDRAQAQGDAVAAAKTGDATPEQRQLLARELDREVAGLGLSIAVAGGHGNTVVTVVFPGGGATGIKTLNDDLVGYAINSTRIIPARNELVTEAFARQGLAVVDQNYKSTTLASDLPPPELSQRVRAALADIDAGMTPILRAAIDEATVSWQAKHDAAAPGSEAQKNARRRLDKMKALRGKLDKDDFRAEVQVGAAAVKGGRDATYDQILAAEMNATKAAIMTRDPQLTRTAAMDLGDARAMAYSEEDFITFAKETVALREQLDGQTLWFGGRQRLVVAGDRIDPDILRALRKGKIDGAKLRPGDRETLALLQRYFSRVNSLDFIKHFTGPEVDVQAGQVKEAVALRKQLEADAPLSKESGDAVAAILAGGTPQADTASEAQFYQRAEGLHERVILNADIKDLGLELFEGYAAAMARIAGGADVDRASQSASDGVVGFKRAAVNEFAAFYRNDLLPRARARLLARGDVAVLHELDGEFEPLILLGGDEITVSLHPAFEDVDLVGEAVAHLQRPSVANARVAVTHTDSAQGGARRAFSGDGGGATRP